MLRTLPGASRSADTMDYASDARTFRISYMLRAGGYGPRSQGSSPLKFDSHLSCGYAGAPRHANQTAYGDSPGYLTMHRKA